MSSRIDYNNPKSTGAFGLPYHYEMVSDSKRVGPFAKAIEMICKGKRVLESGTGSGILSLLAAKAGAKKVYAVEKDPMVFKFARTNISRSRYSGKIKLMRKDIFKIGLKDLDGEKVDVVIAENLSTWQVTEPQIPILNYINKYLAKPGAIILPGEINNALQLVRTKFNFRELIDLRTYYFEFTGIKKAEAVSKPHIFSTIDLSKSSPTSISKSIVVIATATGVVNALRLTSPLILCKNIKFLSSDSLMPPVIYPLIKGLKVKMGNKIEVEINYRYNSSWEEFFCKARIVK